MKSNFDASVVEVFPFLSAQLSSHILISPLSLFPPVDAKMLSSGKGEQKTIFPLQESNSGEKYGKGSNVSKANTENKIT
jgi:hypothetical protein